MSVFAGVMDNLANLTFTEKGNPSLSGMGDARVEAFFKLVRGLSRDDLERHVEHILAQATEHPEEQASRVVDAFLLWASTRDVRGGKGERTLSHWLLATLAQQFPETVKELLPLVPEYGSWRDVVALLEMPELPEQIHQSLVSLFAGQLSMDSKEDAKPSLCAKWAPRPSSAHKGVAKELAGALFPDARHPMPLYRKALATLNRKLGTVEVKMCGHQWSDINPGAVPARCLKVHRSAFMNETSSKKQRFENEDRVGCRKNFEEFSIQAAKDPSAKRMHGRVLHPHEMAGYYMKGRGQGEPDLILEAQWVDLRERLKEEMPALGKMIPLVDVSGSMSGTPMEVAVALGVLISEVGPIKDRFLTFSSNPQWHMLQTDWSLKEKVRSAMSADWGGSTNFQKALEQILKVCVDGNVPPEEVGQLSMVVLSDMQFDAASGQAYMYGHVQAPPKWETQHQALVRSFAEAGLKSKFKQPYPVPRVVYWNLRGNTRDFPVEADTPGVQVCSGFSPSLLKLFMEDNLDEMLANVNQDKPAVDPYQTLRKALDDVRYHPVREVCMKVAEGPMASYAAPPLVQDEFVLLD